MKKLIFTTCCLLATVVFCTQSFAGNNNTKQNDPSACYVYSIDELVNWEYEYEGNLPAASTMTCNNCCVYAGSDRTVTPCGTASVLGPTSTPGCLESSCSNSNCADQWSWSPTTYMTSSSTIEKPTVKRCTCSGSPVTITYTVTGSHSNGTNCTTGCPTGTDQVVVTFNAVGGCGDGPGEGRFTGEEQESNNIHVFSNEGIITINFKEVFADSKVEIYNMNGSLVKQLSAGGQANIEVNMSGEAKGIYVVKVVQNGSQMVSKHIHTDL